jgi:glycosyltransferase involved in cell wall biosynthesis
MRNIAIFQRDLGMGGIQKSLINLLNKIDYDKYNIDLYLFSNENFCEDKLPSKLNIIYLKQLPYMSRFISFKLLKKIKKYNISKSYDLAIDYNSYDPSCAVACIGTNAKEHIQWIHNDVVRERKNDIKYRILRFFFKSKYIYYDKYVCVSKGLIEPFKQLNSIKTDNFSVIPNLVLSDEIINKSQEKVDDITIDYSKYNLVSVGRFVIQKGFDILIEDMKKIVSTRKDIHLYIIGDGKLSKKLKRKVSSNKLDSYITFLGAKSNPFKYESLMDGFVLESRYEGQGIVFLEAKVLGLELIIPKRLENYIDDVPFTDDVCKTIIGLEKKEKKIDKLDNYNEKIIDSINQLFDE